MSNITNTLKRVNQIRNQRVRRVRSVIKGSAVRPRLAVQRSLKHFRAQLIDDASGKTLVSVSSDGLEKLTGMEQATKVGELLAEKASSAGIKTIVFDRRFYNYHGRVKAFAEAVRTGGLQF